MNNKKRGFIAMTTALVISIFLFLISAAVMNYAYQALRTEEWMSNRAQSSLYPLAWSTAHFVLDTLSADVDIDASGKRVVSRDIPNAFVSGDFLYSRDISFVVSLGNNAAVNLKIILSTDSDGNRARVTDKVPLRVTVIAKDSKGGPEAVVMGQIISADNSKGIRIDWEMN